jgi:cell division ATPase FtsA
MEKEEHTQRSMIDGQIEDIEQVARVARNVKDRLEGKLGSKLRRVCVAAAGRALKTQRASYEMEFPQPQRLDDEIISRLEAGAIGEAEAAFTDGPDVDDRQFYLVGHTAVQYYMDNYPVSSLSDHQARRVKAEVIATFLPARWWEASIPPCTGSIWRLQASRWSRLPPSMW